jgi:hypothetical protein
VALIRFGLFQHGNPRQFRSPTDFDIEDYRITHDQTFALDFDNASPDVVFQLADIRVGVELEIKGLLNEDTGDLKATAIKVDLEQFKSIKQTAFVSRAPEGIQRLDGSWVGELRADGQIIRGGDGPRDCARNARTHMERTAVSQEDSRRNCDSRRCCERLLRVMTRGRHQPSGN